MDSLQIDTSPAAISEMMNNGSFHSHQDGRWRYSPHNGETVLVNDPTEQFEATAEFADKCSAAMCHAQQIFAQVHRDGTRGLNRWSADTYALLWQMYSPAYSGDRQAREWLKAQFSAPIQRAA